MVSKNIKSHFLCGVFSITRGISIKKKMLSATTGRQICSGFEAKYKPNNNWSNLTFIKVQQAPALLASQIDRSEPEKFALKIAQSKNGGM